MGDKTIRILVIDDDPIVCTVVSRALTTTIRKHNAQDTKSRLFSDSDAQTEPEFVYEVVEAHDASSGITQVEQAALEGRPFTLAIIDVRMPPGPDGIWAAEQIRVIDPYLHIIIGTAHSDTDTNDMVRRIPPSDRLLFVLKPFHPQEIRQFALALSTKWLAEQENRTMQTDLVSAISEQRELLDYVFNRIHEGIGIVDTNETLIYVNPAMSRIFETEKDKLTGCNLSQFLDEKEFCRVQQETLIRCKNETSTYQLRITTPAGNTKYLSVSAYPRLDDDDIYIGAFGVMTDITEQLKLQEQFIQSQKMEALGSLASGVAHDFNNILTIISGSVGLMQLSSDCENQAHLLSAIEKAVDHAVSLTHQLLLFSRKQKLEHDIIDLNDVVSDIEAMLRSLLDKQITPHIELWPEPIMVSADPGQMRQILMNLIINACDAIHGKGNIYVRTGSAVLVQGKCPLGKSLDGGCHFWIEVEDDGEGMNEETRKRVFEPFFTTKEEGKGTGLGLSTVYGIIERHGGCFDIDSEPGKGTRLRVWLPQLNATE
ncbi:MAG: PAS domain-containing protein [Candidatus Cloacimonetes bacterium]|nr:PAS domain-containing protein [Candidatus Cloacimonadota bacterium]